MLHRNGQDVLQMLAKTFSGETSPRMIRLTEAGRGAFNVPDYVGAVSCSCPRRFEIYLGNSETLNAKGSIAMEKAREKLDRLGKRWIMIGTESDDQIWVDFVHEAAHQRFTKYLDKNIGRLAERFPNYIQKDHEGLPTIHNELKELLTEWYAHEMGYRAYASKFGRHLKQKAGGEVPFPYADERTIWNTREGARASALMRDRHQAMFDYVWRVYELSDPKLKAAAEGKTLSEFLKYGEHGSREALTKYRRDHQP